MPQSSSSWRPILFGGIGALLAALFTFVGNLAYHYLTTGTPGLAYSVSQGPSLPTSEGFKEICVVNARNAGGKEVSDLVVEIDLKQGKIEQGSWRASEGVTAQEHLSDNVYQVRIPLLNPGEHVSLTTMMTTPTDEADPAIAVRAIGVSGLRENSSIPDSKASDTWSLLAALSAGTIALISLTLLGEIVRNNLAFRKAVLRTLGIRSPSSTDLDTDDVDQRETLTYILYGCAIDEEAEKIRLTAAPITYREFADHILARGLRRPADSRRREIVALECMMLVPKMMDGSRQNVKRALRILGGLSDEQIQKLAERAPAGSASWRDGVDRLISEDLPVQPGYEPTAAAERRPLPQ